MTEDNKLVKRGSSELTTLPAFLQEKNDGALGLETLSAKDFILPRLALSQKMSPQLDEDHKDYVPNLKPGMFFNTLTKEIYDSKQPLLVTPLLVRQSRRKFGPRDAGSPTECFSENAQTGGRLAANCDKCPHSKFTWDETKGKNNKPSCTLFYNYLLIIHLNEEKFMPVLFSLKSKGINVAKQFNTFIRYRGDNLPAFAGIYALSIVKENAAGVDFFNAKVENAGWLATEKQYENAKSLFESLHPKQDAIFNKAEEEVAAEAEPEDEEVPF